MRQLNEQQLRFVRKYKKCRDATQAAISAGYSEESARVNGARLLRDPRVIALLIPEPEITIVETRKEQYGNTDDLLNNLWAIADFDLADVGNYEHGDFTFKPFAQWPEGASRAVLSATVRQSRDGRFVTTEFKFCDKLKAIDMLGRYEGIWSGWEQLVAGLKAYGIELERDGEQFMIKGQKPNA